MGVGATIALCIAALIIGAAAAGFICFDRGIKYRQRTAEAAIGSAEKEAERLIAEAEKTVKEAVKSSEKILQEAEKNADSTGSVRKPRRRSRKDAVRSPDRKEG